MLRFAMDKAADEVDIAYVDENRFHPVEIKWTNQIRPNDLKQIARYPNDRILTKARQGRVIQNILTEFLPSLCCACPFHPSQAIYESETDCWVSHLNPTNN